MRIKASFNIGMILSFLFFLSQSLNASYILNDDALIDPRAKDKINQIGKETKEKLGVDIYIHVKYSHALAKDISTKKKIEYLGTYERNILKLVSKPFVLLTLSLEETHVNLYKSSGLEVIDKNNILDDYIVPLLASKDKNLISAKVSAAMLNGYAAVADILAESKNIELESSIGNQGKVASTIWRVFMYFLIVIGLLSYTFTVLRKK